MKAATYAACTQDHSVYWLQATSTPVSAYSLEFLDSLRRPRLAGTDISRRTGEIGQTIHIQVTDSIRVLQVRVMIREHRMSNTVLEAGYAYPSQLYPLVWIYVTTTEFQKTPGFCVDVLASDLAGNLGVDTMEIDSA